jgi:hypothetical protein
MNKGDFVGGCMPYRFKRDGENRFIILTAAQSDNQQPWPPSVAMIFPQPLLDILTREQMVKKDDIYLYDENSYPSDSDSNMKRYLDILCQLAKVKTIP